MTCLVGKSDSGKSAVVRALRWLCFNAPAGTGFVRHGAAGSSVALKLDGRWVVRTRDAAENVYELDGEAFVAQKGSVFPPPAVAAVLNVGPVSLQNQHDPLFWLADTPGQAARSLNAVIDLSDIDAVLDAAAAEVRAAKAEADAAESRHAEAVTRLAETDWVEQFDADLTAVEKTHQTRQDAAARVTALGSALADIDALTHARDAAGAAAAAGERAVDAGGNLTVTARRRAALETILEAGKRLSRVVAADPGPDFAALAALRAAGDAAAERRRELEHLSADAADAEGQRWRAAGRLTDLLAEIEAEAAGRCPLCGAPADTSLLCAVTSTSRPGAPSPAPSAGTGSGSPF